MEKVDPEIEKEDLQVRERGRKEEEEEENTASLLFIQLFTRRDNYLYLYETSVHSGKISMEKK